MIMKLAATLIQRNNVRHLLEYFAWYKMLGVDTFLVYDHMSSDKSMELMQKLSNFYDIRIMQLPGHNASYEQFNLVFQHCLSGEFDWIISADADEFYVPMQDDNLKDFLSNYMNSKLSAIGVYWTMFGNNGHIDWEPGFVTECYTRRAPIKHYLNHHIKSIMRGGPAGGRIWERRDGHCLGTEYGTFDSDGRLITTGLNYPAEITHDKIRIHHYYNKSWEYFKTVKQVNGQKSDRVPGSPGSEIPDEFWHQQNFNDEEDTFAWEKFGERLKESYNIMRNQIGMKAEFGYDN